jgi:PKD repeat protein
VAGFTSNSPVELGQTVVFTNTTIGSEPLSYAWDFGDNFGTSTEKDPTYLYEALGTYTVTLVSDNPFGSDIYTDTVSVVPVAISEINIVKTTDDPLLPGDEIEFTVDISPDNAAKPYEYTIDFGDGTSLTDSSSDDPLVFTHTYTHSGWYTVQVSVKNTGMTNPVIDELSLKVLYRNLLPTISK